MTAPASAADTAGGRRWTMEDLLAGHGQRGLAEADAHLHGNTSARHALNDLANAIRSPASYAETGGAEENGRPTTPPGGLRG